MAPTKGFFSVIQFCPDLDRGEYANVGVILAVPRLGFLDVRLSDDNEGPKQRFSKDAFDDARVSLAKRAIAGRLLHEGAAWSGFDELISDDVKRRIAFVLHEHDARLVREDQIDAFVDEVRREAHQ